MNDQAKALLLINHGLTIAADRGYLRDIPYILNDNEKVAALGLIQEGWTLEENVIEEMLTVMVPDRDVSHWARTVKLMLDTEAITPWWADKIQREGSQSEVWK